MAVAMPVASNGPGKPTSGRAAGAVNTVSVASDLRPL